MPTLLRWHGYRFYFFSSEGNELPHVHVDKAERTTKIWLEPLNVAMNDGFTQKEINVILNKITEYQSDFIKVWYDYFS